MSERTPEGGSPPAATKPKPTNDYARFHPRHGWDIEGFEDYLTDLYREQEREEEIG